MKNHSAKILLIVILLLMVSIPVFAIDCKSIRSEYLKERHRCIGLFREAYAPEKQPLSGDMIFNNDYVNGCFNDLKSTYPEFYDGGECVGVEEKNIDKKFEGYSQKCLHQSDFTECERVLSNVKNVDNIRNSDGATLLMVAAQEGDIDAMDFLLKKRASAKRVDHNAKTLLHYALSPKTEKFSESGDTDEIISNVVKKVLDLDVHPLELSITGITPLFLAIANHKFDLVETIFNNRCSVNDIVYVARLENSVVVYYTALEVSIVTENHDMLKKMMKLGANVNRRITLYPKTDKFVTPLCIAIDEGHSATALTLIKKGANVNEKCSVGSPLELAVFNIDEDVVQALISAKANVNDVTINNNHYVGPGFDNSCMTVSDFKGTICLTFSMLQFAERMEFAGKGSTQKIVAMLKKAGAIKPFEGSFVDYCLQPDLTEKMVYDAIKQGADVNETDSAGWTPLHSIAQEGRDPKAMMALIKKGAFVNAMTKTGFTPLLSAAENNPNPAFVKMLINAGADINALDSKKWNALEKAVASNSPEVVSFLLKTKLGNNLDDANKNRLVMIAVTNNPNPKVLATLFKSGFNAKPVGSGYSMKNPLYIALEEKKDAEIVKLLLQYGGVVDDKCMRLARDLPMDTPEERKYRNQMIDLLTRHKR